MNDEEKFKKDEKIEKDNPGFNGNFDSLMPTEEESDEAAEKCKSAYRALMKIRGYAVGGDTDVQEQKKE